jgi:hypothetical protein
MDAEIKLPPENGQYCFRIQRQIYQLVSLLYPNEIYNAGYEQL